MDDVLVKFFVLGGSCVALVLILLWYVSEPDDR